jgi:hypothetical protein
MCLFVALVDRLDCEYQWVQAKKIIIISRAHLFVFECFVFL